MELLSLKMCSGEHHLVEWSRTHQILLWSFLFSASSAVFLLIKAASVSSEGMAINNTRQICNWYNVTLMRFRLVLFLDHSLTLKIIRKKDFKSQTQLLLLLCQGLKSCESNLRKKLS
ncbi:hypothetical protein Cni_G27887 [Canna indica]|uniref:Uncharacterized protein n=1 Tax=Canna indica TaxID=4628 RepID=A0AAQ3L286_9LILI|nr:hypothetical protein Cni_G27887 [Canna indica]